MTVPDAFTVGVEIARALDASGVPNALGGAIALAAWGVPRATVDVDINVFVEDDDLARVFATLEGLRIEVDRDAATTDHRSRGMFVVRSNEGIRIDVFTPSIDFSWEAAKTATRQRLLQLHS